MEENRTNEGEYGYAKREKEIYNFSLFVSGITPKSTRAIENIKKICDEYLQDFHNLEVIDIYQQPHLAKENQIIAVPTLIKSFPLPIRRFIGDLSDIQKVLAGLNLSQKSNGEEPNEF